MACPTCGATDLRTQISPGYWRCGARLDANQLVGAPATGRPRVPAPRAGTEAQLCGTVYIEAAQRKPKPDACWCGMRPVGECNECSRLVCGTHSSLWRGWRVCNEDLADYRRRAQEAAAEEERRSVAAAAAAEQERERQRTTLLELTEEEALWLLYVQDPRTEQEIRSAVHVLRRVPLHEFTELCLYVLRSVVPPVKSRRSGLRRLSGWPFAGPQYHDRSWFLTSKGDWYRSGSYGKSGAETGHRGKKVRLDDTEKRAIIYDLSWQQSQSGTLAD